MNGKKEKDRNEEASLTIEASLGLTIFIFTIICLIMPMKMLNTQRQVQTVLEETAKELSQYAYIRYRLSKGEKDITKEQQELSSELISLFAESALSVYLSHKISMAIGVGKIEKMDFSKTKISADGEQINLEVMYRLKLPFSIFNLKSVPAISVGFRRGWIGSDGNRKELSGSEEKEDEMMVYVGNRMGRYHRSKDCHYISNDIRTVDFEAIEAYKSSSGIHYKPCSVCGKRENIGTNVYVMPNGEYYHSRKDCTSLSYYVREVPLSEVEYLGECSYCGGGRE
ncbi:MAG: hypothetical protein RR225_00820 [Clostridium sp.]